MNRTASLKDDTDPASKSHLQTLTQRANEREGGRKGVGVGTREKDRQSQRKMGICGEEDLKCNERKTVRKKQMRERDEKS